MGIFGTIRRKLDKVSPGKSFSVRLGNHPTTMESWDKISNFIDRFGYGRRAELHDGRVIVKGLPTIYHGAFAWSFCRVFTAMTNEAGTSNYFTTGTGDTVTCRSTLKIRQPDAGFSPIGRHMPSFMGDKGRATIVFQIAFHNESLTELKELVKECLSDDSKINVIIAVKVHLKTRQLPGPNTRCTVIYSDRNGQFIMREMKLGNPDFNQVNTDFTSKRRRVEQRKFVALDRGELLDLPIISIPGQLLIADVKAVSLLGRNGEKCSVKMKALLASRSATILQISQEQSQPHKFNLEELMIHACVDILDIVSCMEYGFQSELSAFGHVRQKLLEIVRPKLTEFRVHKKESDAALSTELAKLSLK